MITSEKQWILKHCFRAQSTVGGLLCLVCVLAMLSLKCQTALRPTPLSASQKPCQVLATNQLLSLARLFGSAQHGAGLDFKGSLGKVGK